MSFVEVLLEDKVRYLLLYKLVEDGSDYEEGEYLVLYVLKIERGL